MAEVSSKSVRRAARVVQFAGLLALTFCAGWRYGLMQWRECLMQWRADLVARSGGR